jgi:hypothetical protein
MPLWIGQSAISHEHIYKETEFSNLMLRKFKDSPFLPIPANPQAADLVTRKGETFPHD